MSNPILAIALNSVFAYMLGYQWAQRKWCKRMLGFWNEMIEQVEQENAVPASEDVVECLARWTQ